MSTPQFMLFRVPSQGIRIHGLPPNVVPIETIRFKYSAGNGRSVVLHQFPVTFAYAVTDYKSQSKTYDSILLDLKRPFRGAAPPASLYVQLSRCRNLESVSMIRPFDVKELSTPLSPQLVDELRWKQRMYEMYEATLARWHGSCDVEGS